MSAEVLVLAYGNPSRGDDALGPAFAAEVERRFGPRVEVLVDYQLVPEHALDLLGRRRVYFVDADAAGAPLRVERVEPARDESFTTHALTPRALLYVASLLGGEALPECRLIAIGGERFELGEPLSAAARRNLAGALAAFASELQVNLPLA